MTHIIAVDNYPRSPTKGEEIRVPVTILEIPPVSVCALRLYNFDSSRVLSEIWADDLKKNLARKISMPKKKLAQQKLKEWAEKLNLVGGVRILVNTNPLFKKTPDVLEFPIGGVDVKAQFDYTGPLLGKEISVDQVLQEGQFYDTRSITKGKGFQGPIKRFGVKLEKHKAEKGRRSVGTLGPIAGAKTWRTPNAGQMGFHTRTDYNKQLIKLGKDGTEVTPSGGLVKYGLVKGSYALIAGSVGGAKKRLVLLTPSARRHAKTHAEAPQIIEVSRRAQQ